MNSKTTWQNFGWQYLFFFYFSGITHIILQISGSTIFVGLRQSIVMSLLWLIPTLLFPNRTKILTIIIGLMLWVFSLVNIGYFCIYHQEFSQSVIFIIFESNAAETAEFISQYFVWWMIPVLILHTLVGFLLWRKIKPAFLERKNALIVSFSILFILFLFPLFKLLVIKKAELPVAIEKIQNNMEPALPWQLVMGYINYKNQLGNMEKLLAHNAELPPLQNLINENANKPVTLVLVIGESTNKQHMSLYGYGRKTTPKLDAIRKDLKIFNNVVTPRPSTIEALQQVLTFADEQHPDLYLTKPSLMNLMKQAGYKTFWITNQQTLTKRNTMLTTFSKHTDEQVYLNNTRAQNSEQYDEKVLQPFNKILQDPAPRKFIVIHLLGTHLKYEFRYPSTYKHFNSSEGLKTELDNSKIDVINTYDNAILYNDYVVSTLINTFSSTNPNGFLLYLSDHGEDVYDSPPYNVLGRNEYSPTLPMYTIPFIIWTSPSWEHSHTISWESILDRPYSSSHFIHTWSDLAGVKYLGFDETRSLVSKNFKPMPLIIGNPYDKKSLRELKLN